MEEQQAHTLHLTDVMTLVVETEDDDMYMLPNVTMDAVLRALDTCGSTQGALSMVNLQQAAVVVPWRLLMRVSVAHGAGLRDDQAVLIWSKGEGLVAQVLHG